MPLGRGASVKIVVDEIVTLQQAVAAVHPELALFRWHPVSLPNLPAMWNYLGESPHRIVDTAHGQDGLDLRMAIGCPPEDVGEAMGRFETWADTVREIFDDALTDYRPLNGACHAARRANMRTRTVRFGRVDVLAFEFQLEIVLHRLVRL